DFVTVLRTTDVAHGEMVAELLRREGIDALFQKFGGPLIGLPAALARMTVDVPADSAARAKELLADLEYSGAAEALETGDQGNAHQDEDGDAPRGDAGAADGERLLSRRFPPLTAGFALILPGGAHLYARRPWTALVLAMGVAGCLAVVYATRSARLFDLAVAILMATVACDAIGGVRAARAQIARSAAPRGAQLAGGLRLLVIAAAVGGFGALVYDKLFVNFKVSCTGARIFIENHTGQPRTIEIATVEIVGSSASEEMRHEVGVRPKTGCLACSDESLILEVPYIVAARCGERFWRSAPLWMLSDTKGAGRTDALGDCHFAFRFVARKIGVTDDDPIEVDAVCTPPAEDEDAPAAGLLQRIHGGG
ncbi:MAG TPA: hypothetical protein VIF57_31490, partial [Polyangia bacterium]